MRIRTRKKVVYKNLIIILFALLPFSFIALFANNVSSTYQNITSFSMDNSPDPSTFIDANYTLLAQMALYDDNQFELYHIPLNFTCAAVFTDENYTNVSYYAFNDNGALYTGTAMNGYVHKYLAGIRENNTIIENDALRVITKLISGMAMLMIVPNGGLGANYSGILARGWAGPDDQQIAPLYFMTAFKHFNGTGAYSQYRWRAYTSNDEYGGYYMGLALALKYVQDPYVQWVTSQIIDQLCNYMIKTNFLGIGASGAPTGVDQKPKFFSGGFWVPLLLKMGAICFPNKYGEIYYHWVADELCYLSNNEAGIQETISDYFAYNFGHDVVYSYLLLEGNQSTIGQKFYQGYMDSIRNDVKYQRNAYFNAMYLDLTSVPGQNLIVQEDVEDQLMRLDINHFPDRYYGILPVPSNYTKVTSLSQFGSEFQSSAYGGLDFLSFPDVNWNETFYTRPLTVEYHQTANFMWDDNPYVAELGNYTNPLYEQNGLTLTVPYWILRSDGFILPDGMR
jgi:hypothetical protein